MNINTAHEELTRGYKMTAEYPSHDIKLVLTLQRGERPFTSHDNCSCHLQVFQPIESVPSQISGEPLHVHNYHGKRACGMLVRIIKQLGKHSFTDKMISMALSMYHIWPPGQDEWLETTGNVEIDGGITLFMGSVFPLLYVDLDGRCRVSSPIGNITIPHSFGVFTRKLDII